ncbi:Arylsulfatase precursor [Stieleria bergensis]|uniref:Arylsulfatase n=1 Tax=Stieleria bergensis TaxID=2528025 RepID=A0A517SQK8_9BACT|nr:Arylsulfatase precursor [Planctomycetes bacterium SV_7m_r]
MKAPSCLVVLLLLFGSVANAAEPAAGSRPNVIFILLDDMGWGDFGVLHQNQSKHVRKNRTPMLDQMAAEGMQLRQHYCPAPVCAPSRSSLLTGVHQGHAVVRDNQFDKALEDNHTLATVMKAAGYQTWLVGKYGLQGAVNGQDDDYTPAMWPAYPTKRGFDRFYGYVRHRDGHLHYPAEPWDIGGSASHREPKQVWYNDKEVSKDLAKCYTTDLFAARSKDWIIKHVEAGSEQPFFLYLAYDTPHAALQVAPCPYPEGQGVKGGLQWNGKPGEMINTAKGTVDGYRHPETVGKGWNDVEERFASMVRRIDLTVGDLLQTLRDLKIDDNTLVVISCDNGPHHESYLMPRKGFVHQYSPQSFQSYGPFDGTKRDVWEGGIRVGTLAWWPGKIKTGSINESPSQFHDWMVTFADAAGSPAPARADGVSLIPSLTGQGKQRAGQVYVEYFNGGSTPRYEDFQPVKRNKKRKQMQVIMLDGYKGVRTNITSADQDFEIYDVNKDPKELHNLASASPAMKRLNERMKDRVLQMRRPNETAKRPYDDQPIPALEGVASAGWNYETYAGKFPYVPQPGSVAVKDSGASKGLVARDVPGAVTFRGHLKAPKTGRYKVTLTTPSPAFARIHDAQLIDADYQFKPGQTYSTEINLQQGVHPVTVTALGTGDVKLNLSVQPL